VEKSEVIVSDYGDALPELEEITKSPHIQLASGKHIVDLESEPMPEVDIEWEEPKRTFNLQMLPGVGATLAKQLEADGITTEEEFIKLGVEGLSKYRTISESKAEVILRVIEGMRANRD
jgi:predicted flap endonuclease-1-like 5' DNA nuclease